MHHRSITLPLVIILLLTIGFTGCVDYYEKHLEITLSGATITINNTREPLQLTISGNRNNIQVDPQVNLTKVSFAWFSHNNTVWVSSSHNYSVDNKGEPTNTIREYEEG